MKFDYKIEAIDFLEYQLFNASRDEFIQKRKLKGWLLLSIGCALLAVFSFFSSMLFLSIYFIALGIVIALFYPIYFKWRYKKQYGNFILRNYAKSFGEMAEFEITDHYLLSKDKVTTTKVKIDEIERVSETPHHFFIKIKTGITFILPKREIKESVDVKKSLKEIGINVTDELDWKW